jgi:hypothetical protein
VAAEGARQPNQCAVVSWRPDSVGCDDEKRHSSHEQCKPRTRHERNDSHRWSIPREGDVHQMGDFKSVWFKDPDGNILNLVNQTM